ncbi:V-type ATP synthase subunit E family protein [Clostridium sporogenes]|jgi:V/A-type H+-transporting ATPase subunit E|uniref:V-type proton ATPase subunit E n=2 Tax=Clostridium TaxID=1485 RepID=A0A7X5P888_CLOSG|nr:MULTISPECIES: V-type ATP synthase subunit E family protein [Clostridium]AJD29467.1 ATP synthase (E/31 kDa) subunit [Clostridium botulinum Prevot_594]AVP60230.1 V-type ATP synthase subunit E [Clostridium botulinum]AKC63424.1 V-type proton ATPase subunit E [Clostridium sporogenes]AKJ90595.1 ATP synthase subunit E [Clostridium sporogenes]AVP63973.1 V-type ATP synthase subunit E [Clostridium botulinum]
MSSINNLTGKILEEAKGKKEEFIKEAKEDGKKILDKKTAEAKIIEKNTIEKAKRESVIRRERILSNAELKVRNEKLQSKQKIIEKVLEKSLEKLSSLSKEEYLYYIKERILNLPIDGDEKIIINLKDKLLITEDFINEINSELVKRGKLGGLSLSDETRDFKAGFILEKNGIEINNSFQALISSMKDELEYEVARVLFN